MIVLKPQLYFYLTNLGLARKLKAWLDGVGFTTRNGKPIVVSSILEILNNPFYYGEFKYSSDKTKDKLYKGAHKPLISKELFDLIQERHNIDKGTWGSKQFAFRHLLICGRCGSQTTAQDKIKKMSSGEYKRYVYYCCSKNIKHEYDEKYINEEDLCKKLINLIEREYDKFEITDKLRTKVEKHYSLVQSLLDYYKIDRKLDNPFVEYSRYVLSRGSKNEKAGWAEGIKTCIKIRLSTLNICQ